MKINIHKGTNEIGGNCIELSTINTTILLDYGTPLKKGSAQDSLDIKIDSILISHPHQDHFGEIVNIDSKIPVYCGELSLNLMNAAKIFTGNDILNNNFHIYKSWQAFVIGDFKITPYLVDHSAVDAHAFLIEGEGQKILYGGDFRANGRKSDLFNKLITNKDLHNVDILFMEGTMMARDNNEFPTEISVEEKMLEEMSKTDYISFMIGSSQNIDSLVSAYRACKRSGKTFVIDMYTAWILEKIKLVSTHTPNIDWNDVKVSHLGSGSYYHHFLENKEYFGDFAKNMFSKMIRKEDLQKDPSKYLLKISPSHIEDVIKEINVTDANIIYSQWIGYLDIEFNSEKQVKLFQSLKSKYNWIYAHTSGHADMAALKTFSSSINPKNLIPIHTEYKNEYSNHFSNVVVLPDNEYFDLEDSIFNSKDHADFDSNC